jgi:hypothetical protein
MKPVKYRSHMIQGEYYACYEDDSNRHRRYLYVGKFDKQSMNIIGHMTSKCEVAYDDGFWQVYETFSLGGSEQYWFHLDEVEAMCQFDMESSI